ncbi:MAG: ACT domain-containing protein [Opitutaceae bacterium]|nr:ACT domain-containing protein [Opitutaceae bacterium]
MSGEHDIAQLVQSLAPTLDEGDYVFATGTAIEVARISQQLGIFRESEGISVICHPDEAAKAGLRRSGLFRRITLNVHSSLEAVGLTAHVSRVLAVEGIACNVVAGYFHDHLFVPAGRADDALVALRQLGKRGHSGARAGTAP